MNVEYGDPHETSPHGAAIDRPEPREAPGDRVNDAPTPAAFQVSGMADHARQAVSRAAGVVQNTMGEARGVLQSAVDQARDRMARYREDGLVSVQGDVVEYTRYRPLVALGITAAVGLLLGWLGSTARRRQ